MAEVREWVKWEGGTIPVYDELLVEVKLRDGQQYHELAGELAWSHDRHRVGMGTDIIAYRIVKDNQDA